MKWILCCCLAFAVIPLDECSDMDGEWMEPQLLVKKTYCNYNFKSLRMYTFNKVNLEDNAFYDGCALGFDEPHQLNDTFYIECDTVPINCSEAESKERTKYTYYLECEEIDILRNESTLKLDESRSEVDLVRNENRTDLAKGDVFVNKTTEDLDGLLQNGLVNSSEPDILRNETTTEHIDILSDGYANSPEVDVFRNETTTEYYDIFENIHTNFSKSDLLSNKSIISYHSKEIKEDSSDYMNVLPILGCSVAALGAAVGLALAAYKLKSSLQSGSYLFPDTPSPPGFTELA